VVASPLGWFQSQNWDTTQEGSRSWGWFCGNLTAGNLQTGLDNYSRYVKDYIVSPCLERNRTVEECFGTYDAKRYQRYGLEQHWRLWEYQSCREWGYFEAGAPLGRPSLMPRIIDVAYSSKLCQQAFGFDENHRPNVSSINQYGDFTLETDGLMYVDGDSDPWLWATAHSPYSPQRKRRDTQSRPTVLLEHAWHHSDENGLGDIDVEPSRIRGIHEREIEVVKGWLENWRLERQDGLLIQHSPR